MKPIRLGDLLVEAGVITEDQLLQALKEQKDTHKRLGEQLVDSGVITYNQLTSALSMQLGIDYIDLSQVDISPEMTKIVPKGLAKKFGVVPVKTMGDYLYLAMSDPLNFVATEAVRVATRKSIIPMIASAESIDNEISMLYGTQGAKLAIAEMQKDELGEEQPTLVGVPQDLSASDASAPSIRLVNSIIERAAVARATDIHIEPQRNSLQVRMRIDGYLHKEFDVPKELQESLISRIKIMCGMDVTERRVPQDGGCAVRVQMQEIDLRVSTLPAIYGEKVVLRLLDTSSKLATAEDLGFFGESLDKYNELSKLTQGIILIVGPTGSGKSSTMHAILEKLNTDRVNIVTLEDPVEYKVAGVNQIQINEKYGVTFASGLRSILRQDPDIIAVGEIRDAETADIAMRAAMTGHLVLSTLHTNDAAGAVDRLFDIGVEPYVVSGALRGVISQRLVRRICPYCKDEHLATPEEARILGLSASECEHTHLAHGRGCPECYGTGYRGRICMPEVLVITPEVKEAIHAGAMSETISEIAEREGFVPMSQVGRQLVLDGITTVDEVLRVLASKA